MVSASAATDHTTRRQQRVPFAQRQLRYTEIVENRQHQRIAQGHIVLTSQPTPAHQQSKSATKTPATGSGIVYIYFQYERQIDPAANPVAPAAARAVDKASSSNIKVL